MCKAECSALTAFVGAVKSLCMHCSCYMTVPTSVGNFQFMCMCLHFEHELIKLVVSSTDVLSLLVLFTFIITLLLFTVIITITLLLFTLNLSLHSYYSH